jgi:hypothetical protein
MRWVWIRGRRSGKQAQLVPGRRSVRVATPCLLTIGAGWSSMGLGGGGMAAIRSPPTLRAVDDEADQAAQVLADPGVVVVVPIVAVHGAQVPRGKVVMNGVPVVAARVCRACFAPFRRWWVPSGSPGWPTWPGSASTPPPDLETRVQDSLKVSPRGASAWLPP